MRYTFRLALLSVLILLLAISPAGGAPEKKWMPLITGVDSNGNSITTNLYGYIFDSNNKQIFIICNPTTGVETGQAYIPNAKIGQRQVPKITGYNVTKAEDWTQVKRINPVQVRLMAPNILGNVNYTDYSWDYYFQTGILRDSAHGPLAWPGSTQGYLAPGSDPDYWMVVAECTNPNSWPVKANIHVNLGTFRKSLGSSYGASSINQDNEVTLGANETKYVLVSKGLPSGCKFLVDDTDWGSHLEAWSEAYYYSNILENLDPELPENLAPSKGFISFTYYEGTAPVPNNLSGGFSFYYTVECRDYNNGSYYSYNWDFDKGTVSFTPNGWVASPGPTSKNPDLAKKKVEEFFNSRALDALPYVDDDSKVIDNIRFYTCKPSQVSVSSGPYKNCYDAGGPALADYTTVDSGVDLGEGDGRGQLVSDSGTKIPVLKSEPIFVEFYRFTPTDTATSGKLTKEISPGYLVYNSTIDKPTIKVIDTYQGYTLAHENYKVGSKWYGRWNLNINHQVTIQAVNTDSDISARFTSTSIVLPGFFNGVKEFENNLNSRLDADVSITNPIFTNYSTPPIFQSYGTVDLAPGETKTLYSGNVTTPIVLDDTALMGGWIPGEGDINDYKVSIEDQDIIRSLPPFSYTGDAAFNGSNNPTVTFTPNPAGNDQFLSFIIGQVKYSYKGNTRYDDVGVISDSCSPWLGVLSYFSGDGQAMRTTDSSYVKLLSVKKQSAQIREGDKFWPYIEFGSSQWILYKWRDY